MNAITANPARCTAWLIGAALVALGAQPARAADHAGHHHDHAVHAMDHEGHAMMDHSQHVMPRDVSRSVADYSLPDAALTDAAGKPVRLGAELGTDAPVMVNFIFTTCTAICPLTSAVFAQVQDTLAAEGKPFRLISISIDPEQDTPARLSDFARRFGAGTDWHFLTGDIATVLAVQQAFDAWRGGKMNHAPLTFLRAGNDSSWVRYEGLVDAKTLVEEYRRLSAGLKTARR